jgi:hypothetical protein
MVFTALENIAAIFIFICVVKTIFVIFDKRTWYEKIALKIYSNPKFFSFLFLILSLLILNYIRFELNFVQIFSVIAFMSLMIGFVFLQYNKEVILLLKKIYNKKFSFWLWIYILFWIIILALASYELLFKYVNNY